MAHTREYLEEALRHAKKNMPGWAYAYLVSQARASAGGRAHSRTDEPTLLEKLALGEIRPATLRDLPDEEVKVVWDRLETWFNNARRRKQPVEDFVNAGVWVMREMHRRDIVMSESDFNAEVMEFFKSSKLCQLEKSLNRLPKDVLVISDFVSVVGSAVQGEPDPNDLDILVRAMTDGEDNYLLGLGNIQLPVRKVLDPKKEGGLHWIGNAQGPHGDHVALYDLVLRRKERIESKVAKSDKVRVPTAGPENAPIAFVGASPDKEQVIRREAFSGPIESVFDEKYLTPLGFNREQVLLTNVCPELLQDANGKIREPNEDEIEQWRGWVIGELDRMSPAIVVALGQVARKALGDRADFVMPHPAAILRRGDSGEVSRKLKKVREQLESVAKQDEEDRAGVAQREWDKNWQDRMPSSGRGKFVYQHHWRGLGEDEIKLSDAQLLDTDHSLHGDLRLEGDDGLWGGSIFLGSAADNKRVGGDKLFALKDGDNLRFEQKLQQPKEWLRVGTQTGGQVIEPGGPGSTSQTYSKFFARDEGTYQLGVALQNSQEIFLDGKHLKGVYLLVRPWLQGQRVWLIDKPKDQTPRAEREDLADVISEQRRKGRQFVIWAKPGERPVRYDTRTGEVVKMDLQVQITKADPSKHIVYGAVMDPYGPQGARADSHDDWIPPATIEAAAHDFMKGPRTIGMQHRDKADATLVESWIEMYPDDEYHKALREEPHKVYRKQFGDDVVHSGSWMVGVQLGDAEWDAYERGEINAFSPGGFGLRTPITREQMPKVEFIDLVPKEQANA